MSITYDEVSDLLTSPTTKKITRKIAKKVLSQAKKAILKKNNNVSEFLSIPDNTKLRLSRQILSTMDEKERNKIYQDYAHRKMVLMTCNNLKNTKMAITPNPSFGFVIDQQTNKYIDPIPPQIVIANLVLRKQNINHPTMKYL